MQTVAPPPSLTGSEFQSQLAELSEVYTKKLLATWSTSGVQATRTANEWLVIPSKPDFEGVIANGPPLKFDTKVCSAASFAWAPYRRETGGSKARQLKYMLHRSKFGEICFFLIHWNARELKKVKQPAETHIIPVVASDDYWEKVDAAEIRTLSREDGRARGVVVEWAPFPIKPRPILLPAIFKFWGGGSLEVGVED